MKTLAFLVLCTATLAGTSRAASDEALRQRWLSEAQRLEAMQDEYEEAADAQEKTLKKLEAARGAVDAALADPAVNAGRLRELEDALTDARDEALHAAEAAAAVREDIYDQIEALEELGAEAEGGGAEPADDGTVAGQWRAEWDESGEFGLVKLEVGGDLVTGTFRLTNGSAGSLRGTVTGAQVRLDVVNASRGFTGTILAQVRLGADSIEGTFTRNQVADGQRAAGNLRLTRLDPEDAREALEGMR